MIDNPAMEQADGWEEAEPYPYPFYIGEYDERLRNRVRQKLPSWKALAKRREPEFKEFDKLLSSMFFSLYKHSQIEADPLTPSAEKMKQLLHIAEGMPEWQDLNNRTKGDYVLSSLASVVIGEHIVIPEEAPGGNGDDSGNGEGEDEKGDEGKAPSMANSEAVREALLQGLQAATEAADNADTLSQLWGEEAGEDLSKDPETLLALIKTLSDSERLKLISRMLGRLRNQLYRSQMSRSQYVPEEFVDVELGDNLANMLPSGRLLLAEPELEVVFLMKFLQKALLQQVREGNIPENQGPIIVLVDISGSMGASLGDVPNVGTISRLDWALSVALTLTILARRQNREYYIGIFDTYIRREIKSSDGPVSSEALVGMMSVHPMGGTNFESPLRKGLEIMKESAYNKADLVFVTDGECHISDQFLKEYHVVKDERNFRTLGIACASANPAILKKFCDRSLSVGNVLQADEASREIFSMGE